MDDTDGPKHCGEERLHMPHEYEVLLPATGPRPEQDSRTMLWSCDGKELGTKKLPADIRIGAMEISTVPLSEGLTEVVTSMRYVVDNPSRLEATLRVLEVLR